MSLPALALAGHFGKQQFLDGVSLVPATLVGFALSGATRSSLDRGRTHAAVLAVAGYLLTDWSTPVFLSVAVPVLVIFSYAFLPRSMAMWVAFEYMVDVSNGESWAQPRR